MGYWVLIFCGFYLICVWWSLINGFEIVGMLIFRYMGLSLWSVSWLSESLICGEKLIALHHTSREKPRRCRLENQPVCNSADFGKPIPTVQWKFWAKSEPIEPCTPSITMLLGRQPRLQISNPQSMTFAIFYLFAIHNPWTSSQLSTLASFCMTLGTQTHQPHPSLGLCWCLWTSSSCSPFYYVILFQQIYPSLPKKITKW